MDGAAFEVWPDNWAAVDVFIAMGTQWRAGANGPTGLDYPSLESVFRLQGVRRLEREDIFAAVRIMEGEALKVMREK
ncbi:hypothetical protein D9M68_1005080 [compost metagenome]